VHLLYIRFFITISTMTTVDWSLCTTFWFKIGLQPCCAHSLSLGKIVVQSLEVSHLVDVNCGVLIAGYHRGGCRSRGFATCCYLNVSFLSFLKQLITVQTFGSNWHWRNAPRGFAQVGVLNGKDDGWSCTGKLQRAENCKVQESSCSSFLEIVIFVNEVLWVS
jgi:hypothetical protein